MKYTLWVAALLGVCDVTQDGSHLGFYLKIKTIKKGELSFFDARRLEYDILLSILLLSVNILCFYHLKVKTRIFSQKWLGHLYL